MRSFSVMLEGRDGGDGFFITVEVAAADGVAARQLAISECTERGLQIVRLEEVEHGDEVSDTAPAVKKVYGRILFPLES